MDSKEVEAFKQMEAPVRRKVRKYGDGKAQAP
jgi:hypothetical protein